MKKKIFGYIQREINHLTNDEDLRQELWVHFLEGNPLNSLEHHLKEVQLKQAIEKDMLTHIDMELTCGIKT